MSIREIISSSGAGIISGLVLGIIGTFAGMFMRGTSNSAKIDRIELKQEHAEMMRGEDRERAQADRERIKALEGRVDAGFGEMHREQQQGFKEIREAINGLSDRLDHKRDK